MPRVLVALALLVMAAAPRAQQPPASPTQAETLAKWPWSISLQPGPFKRQSIEITLASKEGMEYKYRLDKGEALLYSWKATGPVNVEFHAEPDGAPRGYAQTYEKADRQTAASGTLTAPFAGIHGWYWENTTGQPVTVTLTSAGYYNLSHEFRSGAPTKNKTF